MRLQNYFDELSVVSPEFLYSSDFTFYESVKTGFGFPPE